MSYIGLDVFAPVRARLLRNKVARAKYGALLQDFDRLPGEVFYGNMTAAEFKALALKSKRQGGPAIVARLLSEVVEPLETPEHKKTGLRVFVETYERRYNDKTSTAVYVHTYELDMLGIDY